MARGSQGESGLRAGRVRIVPVDALPGVLVGIKGEVSGKKEDIGTGFTALANPSASKRQIGCRAAGQHRGALV